MFQRALDCAGQGESDVGVGGGGGGEVRLGEAGGGVQQNTEVEVAVKSLAVSFNNTGKDLFK